MPKQAYQVIARRWRPQQFSELVGQDHVVKTLGNAIEMERIAHAYLFVGPRGTGKTTSARLFAKSLNWEEGPSLEVPHESEIGQAIMEGRCLDVIEIDGASNNSVDQVRELRDECQYAPAQCRFKIYVIDEVHMLSQAAFNALLKTLEEPPPHVKFVFATTESQKVLPTIVSRCQRFEFRSIPVDLIKAKLSEICEKESITVDPEALEAISRMAMGGMRDAQSILDQMISFCGKELSQKDVLEVYGLVSSEEIKNLGSCLIDGDYGKTLAITDSFATVGVDFYRALLDLADFFRDRLVNELNNESSHSYPEQVVRILDALQAGEDLVRTGLSEKTNFEVTMFRAMEAGKSRSIDQLIRRISGVLPEQVKKKTEQPLAVETPVVFDSASSSPSEEELVVESSQYDSKSYDSEKSGSTLLMAEPSPQQALPQEKTAVEDLSSDRPSEAEGGIEKTAPLRQVKDQGKIEERIATLPPALRDLLEEKFRGEFVAIEQINRDRLI